MDKQVKREIIDYVVEIYKLAIKNRIGNRKTTEQDIWVIENSVNHTLEYLSKNRLLKNKKIPITQTP